jgi:hypothetical protein
MAAERMVLFRLLYRQCDVALTNSLPRELGLMEVVEYSMQSAQNEQSKL